MKKILIAIMLAIVALTAFPAGTEARGGGGARGGGARASSRSSASRPSTSKPASKPSTAKPSTPKVSTKPSATTKTVTAAKPKTANGKTFSQKGSVVDGTYAPRFGGGYSAPVGSTVYYRQSSMLDWLPFYMIMNNQQHREAVVVQPDGKEQVVKEEGTDGMYILNWIITILLCGGLIAGIVYLINRYTKR